ncbi:MAG: hypothetical protein N2C14_19370 [Planctomycetales bacterium]
MTFTDASYSRAQLAEVDATAGAKQTAEFTAVGITLFSSAR